MYSGSRLDHSLHSYLANDVALTILGPVFPLSWAAMDDFLLTIRVGHCGEALGMGYIGHVRLVTGHIRPGHEACVGVWERIKDHLISYTTIVDLLEVGLRFEMCAIKGNSLKTLRATWNQLPGGH